MSIIAYREEGGGLWPRHPVVCALDIAGFAAMVGLLATYPQPFTVSVLPITIAALYIVSGVFHWLPHNTVRQKVDHCMIAMVIATTYVPLWATLLPLNVALKRFATLGVILCCVLAIKLLRIHWRAVGGAAFLLLGAYPVLTSVFELQEWLPAAGLFCFWAGIVLYALQHAVYASKWPDLLPQRFGFREVQHSILLVATTAHSWTVLAYL